MWIRPSYTFQQKIFKTRYSINELVIYKVSMGKKVGYFFPIVFLFERCSSMNTSIIQEICGHFYHCKQRVVYSSAQHRIWAIKAKCYVILRSISSNSFPLLSIEFIFEIHVSH